MGKKGRQSYMSRLKSKRLVLGLLLLTGVLGIVIFNFRYENTLKITHKAKNNPENRVVFIVGETGKSNVYSVKRDGTDKKLLISDDNNSPKLSDFKISPDGLHIAYLRNHFDLMMLSPDGQNNRQLTQDEVTSFYWRLDGTEIIYQWRQSKPANWEPGRPYCVKGECVGGGRIIDVANGKTTDLKAGDQPLGTDSWINANKLLAANASLNGQPTLITHAASNRSGTHSFAVVTLSSSHEFDSGYMCNIYELSVNQSLGEQLIADRDGMCSKAFWSGDDMFFYGKAARATGPMRSSYEEADYYKLDSPPLWSIYKYDYFTKQKSLILKASDHESYELLSVSNKNLVTLHQLEGKPSQFALEIRNLIGQDPITLARTSRDVNLRFGPSGQEYYEKGIQFIGWTE